MAVWQRIIFGGLPVLGADVLLKRGPRPGKCRLRLSHDQGLNLYPDDLAIESDGGRILFQGCVPDLKEVRSLHRPGRRREYILHLYDRRKTWADKTVSGKYNVRYRDDTIKPSTKKTIAELCDLLMQAAGETTTQTPDSDFGEVDDVFPFVDWQDTPLPVAFDQLCAAYPLHVCRNANDTYNVQRTGQGDTLPDEGGLTTPVYPVSTHHGPQIIRFRCAPTLFQQFITLQFVGRDTDGAVKPIDDLSYMPQHGWSKEHPQFFAGVAQQHRHLAFKTVFRWLQIVPDEVVGVAEEVEIRDWRQYDLYEQLIDVVGDADDKQEIPAFVTGYFWPMTDHPFPTGHKRVHWSGNFRILHEWNVVEFDDPVIAYYDGEIVYPELWLYTSFNLRDANYGLIRKTIDRERDHGAGEWIIDHPEVWEWHKRAWTDDPPGADPPDNNTQTVEDEAEDYLDPWESHWDTVEDRKDITAAGTARWGLSGNVAQLRWQLGKLQAPFTRGSHHYAFEK